MPVTPMTPQTAARLRGAPLTYAAAGQTAGVLPPGYRHTRASAVIGSGEAAFTAAAAALLTWEAHVRAGLHVSASSAAAEPGSVVLLGAGADRSVSARRAGSSTSPLSQPAGDSPTARCPGIPKAARKPSSSAGTTTAQ